MEEALTLQGEAAAEAQMPKQSIETNVAGRPSSGDSPASETSSKPAPRG